MDSTTLRPGSEQVKVHSELRKSVLNRKVYAYVQRPPNLKKRKIKYKNSALCQS